MEVYLYINLRPKKTEAWTQGSSSDQAKKLQI